ncbi:MAG: JAB domain-containing protein [Desulfuromonadales bacterium]
MNDANRPQRKLKSIRFKIIRPVYETHTVNDQNARYLDAHLSSSRDVVRLFDFLSRETKEHFWAVHLDSKNRLLCLDQVSTGSLNASIVHPREVYKSALLSSAAALLLVHNHPSGDPTPSAEDREITMRLKAVSELLGIRLLDHIVIGDGRHYSFADQGIL